MRLNGRSFEFGFVLLACGLTAWALHIPLLHFDAIFVGDDLKAHYRWAAQFALSLSEGYWYPRWMPREHLGIGEPAFLYYPPLYSYLISALNLVTGDIWLAMKGLVFLSNLAAGTLAFLVLRRFTSLAASLAGGIVTQTAPFVYHMAAYHNFLPFHASYPLHILILYLTFHLTESKRWLNVTLAVGLALLFLLHIVSAVMVLIVLSLFIVLRALGSGRERRVYLLMAWGTTVLTGIGLAAVYLIPALTTMDLLIPQQWYEPPYVDWRNSFCLPVWSRQHFGMRWFSVQWVIALSLLIPLVLATVWFWKNKKAASHGSAWLGFGVSVSWIAWFFGTEVSWWFWASMDLVQKIQFPYRFLFVLSACTLPLLAFVAADGLKVDRSRWWLRLSLAAAAGSIGLTAVYAVKIKREGQSPDFNPISLESPKGPPPLAYFITKTRGPDWKTYMSRGGLNAEAEAKGIRVETIKDASQERSWQIDSPQAQAMVLPLYAFPAWTVTVSGQIQSSRVDAATGLITVDLEPGRQEVRVFWTGLPQERWGRNVSFLTSLMVIGIVVRRLWK